MAIETLPTGYCVDFSSSQSVDFAIKENEFTAGYTAREADGIHNVRDTWNANFSKLTLADMGVLWEFLRNKKGYISFYWTPPNETQRRKWTCEKLSRTMDSSNEWTISTVLKEQFIAHLNETANTTLARVTGIGQVGIVGVTIESTATGPTLVGVAASGVMGDLNGSILV